MLTVIAPLLAGAGRKQTLPGGFFLKGDTKVKLAALCLVPFIMVLGNSMLIPILPQMKSALRLTQLQTSLVITAFSIPAGIAIALAGFLSDRFGRKPVIVPSLIIYGLGGLVAGLAAVALKSPYWLILIGRVIQGIGAAGTAYVAMALAGDIFTSSERSTALGLLESSNGFGKVVSPILGSLVALITWYSPFFFYGVLALPAAAAVGFVVKEPSRKEKAKGAGQYFSALAAIFKVKTASLLASLLAGAVVLFLLFGILFFFSEILEKEYNIDGLLKGVIIAGPVLVMSVTSYLTGKGLQKLKNYMKAAVVVGLAIEAVSLAVPGFFRGNIAFFAAIGFLGLGSGFALPALNTLITSSTSIEQRGMVTSAYGAVRFFGVAIGPPVFGILMGLGNRVLFFSGAGLAALASAVAFFLINQQLMLKPTGGGGGGTRVHWTSAAPERVPATSQRSPTIR